MSLYCLQKNEDVYTLVKTVNHRGPAEGKLAMGDNILSANGNPLNKDKVHECQAFSKQPLKEFCSLPKNDP